MRLILGILSIILSIIVFFQSLVAMLGDALENVGGVGGFAGVLVSIAMLVAGIVALAGGKSRGTHMTAAIFWLLAGLFGFMLAGNYTDLNIWSTICIIFAVLHYVFVVRKLGKNKAVTA